MKWPTHMPILAVSPAIIFPVSLMKKTGRPQERADKQAAQECLVDDEKPSPQIAIFLPVLLLVIVRFGILPGIGEVAVAMVLRMRLGDRARKETRHRVGARPARDATTSARPACCEWPRAAGRNATARRSPRAAP